MILEKNIIFLLVLCLVYIKFIPHLKQVVNILLKKFDFLIKYLYNTNIKFIKN